MRSWTAWVVGGALGLSALPAWAQREPGTVVEVVAPRGPGGGPTSAPSSVSGTAGRRAGATPTARAVATPGVSAAGIGPAPAAPVAAVPASTMPAPPNPAEVADYAVRFADLQRRIGELRADAAQSRAHMEILAEQILQDPISGSRALIQFQNEMGDGWRLDRATFLLDGVAVSAPADDRGSLSRQHLVPVFNGQITPGDHTLTVVAEYVGTGAGLFPYLSGYRLQTRSVRTFTVSPGNAIDLRAVGYAQGSVTDSPESRSTVRFVERTLRLRDAVEGDTDAASGRTP